MKKICTKDVSINGVDFYKGMEYEVNYCAFTKRFLIANAFNQTTDTSLYTLKTYFI